MLVEERGLENQIKRLKDLIPNNVGCKENNNLLQSILLDLEVIKLSIKSENDRILTDQFKSDKSKQLEFNFNQEEPLLVELK